MWYSSAPANIMIMGEHSVLAGHPALVATLNERIRIRWSRRSDRRLLIRSVLADHETSVDAPADHPHLHFVLQPFRYLPHPPTSGLEPTIESDFPSDWGLGSSAAVLAATIVGLQRAISCQFTTAEMFSIGLRCIHDIQQRGSGADLAAALHGGLTWFEPQNNLIEPVAGQLPDMTLVYSGYKTPTAEVLRLVAWNWQDRPKLLAKLYNRMGRTTQAARLALVDENLPDFFETVADYQLCMQELGVCDPTLEKILELLALQSIPAKISGSGLGDSILAFAELTQLDGFRLLPVKLSTVGAVVTNP